MCRESATRIKDLVDRGNHNHTGREGSNHKRGEGHRSKVTGDGERGQAGRGRQQPGDRWSGPEAQPRSGIHGFILTLTSDACGQN